MKKLNLGIGIGIASLAVVLSADANLVLNGGFETPDVGGAYQTYATGATIGAWKVTAGSVDLINTYWGPSAGEQSLDMAGGLNGTIKQTIGGLTIGTQYLLTFDMAGNPDGGNKVKTLEVTFGSLPSQTFTFDTTGKSRTAMGWTPMSAYFLATAASMDLIFKDLSTPPGTPYGSALDNVSLAAVPEPSTVIAGGLLLLPFAASTIRKMRKVS